MVLSPAEKQRHYRERQKAAKEAADRLAQKKIDALFPATFHEFFNDHGDNTTFHMAFDAMGMDAPEFIDNSHPKSLSGEIENIEYGDNRLCCTNPVSDSSRESSVVAGWHEQTHTPRLQDQELARL